MTISPPARIAILGPGLLGGSLLLALRERIPGLHLSAWARRAEAVEDLASMNVADVVSSDLKDVVSSAQLVVLCTPIETMHELATQIAPHLPGGCVVTDVGSVKGCVVAPLEGVFQNISAEFIGSHPMAGSERSGIGAAKPDLFEGAVSIITPTIFTTEHAVQAVCWLWQTAGCRILEMSAEDHDRNVARISHLPHLAAAALTVAALRHDPSVAACAGNGFRDSTRIASGDPELWTGIIAQNRTEVIAALREASSGMSELLAIIAAGDDKALLHLLQEAKNLRDAAVPG